MRVAALYDIHGNAPALEAVLADVAGSGADMIVVGGDVVEGPLPAETLTVLDAVAAPLVWVRGNCDRDPSEAGPPARPEATRRVAGGVAHDGHDRH